LSSEEHNFNFENRNPGDLGNKLKPENGDLCKTNPEMGIFAANTHDTTKRNQTQD
jgi:hypothetical protein